MRCGLVVYCCVLFCLVLSKYDLTITVADYSHHQAGRQNYSSGHKKLFQLMSSQSICALQEEMPLNGLEENTQEMPSDCNALP